MQINPRCTKINFKTVQKTAFLCITAIAFSAVFSSCSADDIEMPMKTEIGSETFMKRIDSIPKTKNDSMANVQDIDIDPPFLIPPKPPKK